jgi:hypothetical protein
MKTLILSFIFLTGCSITPPQVNTIQENTLFGSGATIGKYSNIEARIYIDSSKRIIEHKNMTDYNIYEIVLVNHDELPQCVNITILYDGVRMVWGKNDKNIFLGPHQILTIQRYETLFMENIDFLIAQQTKFIVGKFTSC